MFTLYLWVVCPCRETLLELTKDQEAALQRTAQAHAGNAAKYRAMLMKIDQGKLTRLESRGAAGGRFVATSGDETLTMLSESVSDGCDWRMLP